MKKRVQMPKVLSQSVEGWDPGLRPFVRLFHRLTVVVAVVWVMFKWFNPTYSYFGDRVLALIGASLVFAVAGYIFFKEEQELKSTSNSDDRTLANMMIELLSQDRAPDSEQMTVWFEGSRSIDDIIAHLEQLTPEGLKYVGLYRETLGIVPKAKANRSG